MLDVGIEVEVRAHGGAQPVLIGQRAPGSAGDRRPTPGAFPVGGQNYGAGYLFFSLESFASWRLERSGREIQLRERTMGQAICDYSPPGSELWGREKGKLWGRLFISL